MKKAEINYQAWSNSLIGFIRSKGLERELTDWCGGWKCPIQSSDGGVGVRHAEAGNKAGSIPEEARYPSATRLVREEVQGAATQPCAGVTPGPSDAYSMSEALDWLINCVECEVNVSRTTTVFQLRLAQAKEALAADWQNRNIDGGAA